MYTWLVLQMRFFNLEKCISQLRHVHFKISMKSSQESLRMWCTGGATNAGPSFPRITRPLLGENALFIVVVSNQMKELLIDLFCPRWNWRIILTFSVPAVLTVVIRSVLLLNKKYIWIAMILWCWITAWEKNNYNFIFWKL